ncbi:ubiquitin domain-containing protein UBFD1-like [Cloeon dipterum]|uniref:ubiquitin domain-containing protein UBFD1-like n=1 Tax=Cloeon dipterum TaxID=197152 RepID=UPI00322089FB
MATKGEEKEEIPQKMEEAASEATSESKTDFLATVNEILKSQEDPEEEEEESGETVSFKVIFCKTKHEVEFGLDKTILKLKNHLQDIIGVPASMQKLMIKGLAQDEQTLRSLGVSKGAKVLVVGSKLDDVIAVSAASPRDIAASEGNVKEKESYCSMAIHKKVLDKGIPDEAMPGIKGVKEALPSIPLYGMLNKQGKKVRLTFKMELDQLWIGTLQRTDRVPMNSIKAVVSEPITGYEQYHILALQLGPTEASRYWIYWVPAQYADAIKDAILGKWQYF